MRFGVLFKGLFFLVLLFLFVELIFLFVPKFIVISSYSNEIKSSFYKVTGEKLNYERINLKTYPNFDIGVGLISPEIGDIARAEAFDFRIGLFDLFFKKISISELLAKEVKIHIKVNEDNTTNLDKIFSSSGMDLDLKRGKFNITRYKIFIENERIKQNIEIEGDNTDLTLSKEEIGLDIVAKIISNDIVSSIDLDIEMPNILANFNFVDIKKFFYIKGRIKNFRPVIFEKYLREYFDKDIIKADGVINAEFIPAYEKDRIKSIKSNIEINNFAILNKVREKSIIFGNKNLINSVINFDKRKLSVEKFEFTGDKFKILSSGKIDKWETKTPKLDIGVSIKNARVEELYWMLPSNLFTQQLEILKIKKYGAYADVEGGIKIKGKPEKPEVYGQINFNNVWVLNGLPEDVPKAIVKTYYDKDRVLVDVKAWATPEEYVTVVGWSDFFDLSKNEYQINSTKNVPLAVAEEILVPVSDVLGFLIGPVPIMDITGFGNIDLYAAGTKEKPILKGYFRYNDATASFNGINLKLENADGGLDFSQDKITFYTDRGYIWGQPASIKGVSDSAINIDYKAVVKNVQLGEVIKTLKTSPMICEQVRQIKLLDFGNGIADLDLDIVGHVDMKDIKTAMTEDFIKYITPRGKATLKNSSIGLKNPKITLSDVNGSIKFDLEEIMPDIEAKIFDSPVNISGKISENSDLKISSNKMRLRDSIKFLIGTNISAANSNFVEDFSNSTFKLNLNYDGGIEDIDFNKVKMSAIFPEKNSAKADVDVLSGEMLLNNGEISFKNFNANFYNSFMSINGRINNLFVNPVLNADIFLSELDLSFLNDIKKLDIVPKKLKQILEAYKDYRGKINFDISAKNNVINGSLLFKDIYFIHSALGYPFSVKSADFEFKKGDMFIKRINASFAGTPIFLSGGVRNFIKNPNYDIYFTSKLSSDFVDNYINTFLSYPINVNGEVLLSSKIEGTTNNMRFLPSVKIEEGADVSYMGANLGDENCIRELSGEIKKIKHKFIIENIDYSKYIYSQNNRLYPLPLINMNAQFDIRDSYSNIDWLKLKTYNPINAKIFNAIFKKSLIKYGNIMCDVEVSGEVNKPKILGFVSLDNVSVPTYNTEIDKVNIKFMPKNIDINAKTKYLGSDIDVIAILKNDIFNSLYFENLEIHSKTLNLDKLLYSLNEISYSRPIQNVENTLTDSQIQYDLKKLYIDKGKWIVDNIIYKTIPASDFVGNLSMKNNYIKIEDVSLKVADGELSGDFGYNIDNATLHVKTEVKAVDANKMSYAFLDIENQIHGKLDGKVDIKTFGATDEERMKNLNGIVNFNIKKGKMPKLGSIEYLLRASNLIKSGFSGLTLNNIKSILIPFQSGEFDLINGELTIADGFAENIKIYSKGQNLSILISGNYNILSSVADIYILGKLSKNIDTILGPIGNASLNSLFNLIPGVHLDEITDTDLIKQINSIPELGLKTDKFRIFRAKVDGDINSESFVSKFEWLDK